MPPKRKIRNLRTRNDQVSFFDPVYQNNGIPISDDNESGDDENDLLAEGIPRPTISTSDKNESNETLDNATIVNSDHEQSSEILSTSKLIARIREIQKSIYQAQTMLESMEKYKDIVPGCTQQHDKLRSIIHNLEEQQASYVNLLNLITLTAEERSAVLSRQSASKHQAQLSHRNEEEEDDDDDEDGDDDLSLRGNIRSPIRPRIESKIGFVPQAPTPVLPTINLSDNEQNSRNDYSNYDSLVGSLKSDTLNWKDQQGTSDEDATDAESEKEMERNLTLQKEQIRALQGQQRALLALKRRSEQRLMEQQQQSRGPTSSSMNEDNLLSDIHNLRDRLKLLRSRYEQKHQRELQLLKNSSKQPRISAENRLKNLKHVHERLDELEQIVTYYQTDVNSQPDEESPQVIDEITANDRTPEQLDELSSELAAKRLELEQAKSALGQLQHMVKKIQPDEYSSSASSSHSTPLSKSHGFERCNNQFTYSARSSQHTQTEPAIAKCSSPVENFPADMKIAAQHREIERLVESRQRLHTLKNQITSLHQTMNTPSVQLRAYEEKLNDSKNLRPTRHCTYAEVSSDDDESSAYPSDIDVDKENCIEMNRSSPIKQSNLCASDSFRPKLVQSPNELNEQMREISACLSTFIQEQKSFNRHIEQRLTATTESPVTPAADPVFSQLQNQVLTQGLIVNLNTAYREIAVLQSEINALQSENNRLTSSISFDQQYMHQIPRGYAREDSKDSIYAFNQTIRPRPRPSLEQQSRQQNLLLMTNRLLENPSSTSFQSQSTSQQTAIRIDNNEMDASPIQKQRNGTFSTDDSSPRPSMQPKSDIYDLPNQFNPFLKEDPSKSFIIHRRPVPTENQLNDYKQKSDQQSTLSSVDDYQQLQELPFNDDTDDERQSSEFSTSVFNIQPESHYTLTNQNISNNEIQTIDLQVKSIMVQLIPFMRLHINDIFNQSILCHIRGRILFLFKQQPDSAQLLHPFENQFSELVETTIEKYCGSTIRECAADLIRDVSNVAFDEMIRYKIYQNTNFMQTKTRDKDDYSHLYDNPSARYHAQQTPAYANGENGILHDTETEEPRLTSNGNDSDSDEEENELQSTVRLADRYLHANEHLAKSNGHEYILVNNDNS
ncbi:unnamed protein product [Adineta ricciae]|uniref:Pericentriolar material 1 protein C-terminal domain-containing protein n=1 Tax=Adineta ricciae TaxID=249248 RepID=A0A813T7K7_ADIRI|nr:unnamed protein product [Adineta ricciae]CAF1082600.1 unnamed protein product [Adineta ricciae]